MLCRKVNPYFAVRCFFSLFDRFTQSAVKHKKGKNKPVPKGGLFRKYLSVERYVSKRINTLLENVQNETQIT